MEKKALESKLKRLKSKQKKLADPSRLDEKIHHIENLLKEPKNAEGKKEEVRPRRRRKAQEEGSETGEKGGKSPEDIGG